ncbi:ROK family protein [Leptospira fainei serovar Hurstbridge str. BUT 6]|uniref:ROK family protein n=1 Tax=Leptospira fainei serovar Hurstbridge str. BUT 6 TaxID=1193011 RepID=S3V149_9LEPT|nr:ROK family protein [Leptospira fainei]EPG75173.1 ROK family protein [Leptospira fainei serovar Hurstbridge str. BUT 6]
MKSFLGVDIGAQSVKACRTDEHGTLLSQSSISTGADIDSDSFLSSLKTIIQELMEEGNSPVSGIGLGSPGPLDKDAGILISSANLPKLKNVPIVSYLKDSFGIPVYYDNDANCAALGEYWYGVGKGSRNLVVITLGTGIGGGWVYEGSLFDGYKGNSMEVGHNTIRPGGTLCGCGHRGCAEAYFSTSGFSTRYRELTGRNFSDAKEFFSLVKKGEQEANLILEEGIEILSELIRNLIHILNPECVVLSGGLVKSYSLFGKQLEKRVREIIFPVFRNYTRILAGGSVTGALGAASLCLGRIP